ncbi:class 1 fructose-bisphosphatase [Motiliproteus coralliicola]|uniref:Fructose-1,6-bisphosphatase class 1 n=1 Tax=Motiliproteus coralliicola TaxID=2283196 RepID=A0A369WD19_9GAMM|nr:class 1 fructose-bisphosphatase [Motiliproteus coralliicola]RDE19928.1 class 1 fructose-bisphosphatase [Motiliproteus coralliicola]
MLRLTQFLKQQETPADLIELVNLLMAACKEIDGKLQDGALAGILGAAETENVQGETQKKLDVIANDILKLTLSNTNLVAGLASEEEDDPVACDPEGKFLVTFDPLDGSSNIDINVSVGTIFSILEAPNDSDPAQQAAYLQSGRKQVAAGYVLYGPSCILVMTTGNGVHMFTLGSNGEFYLTRESVQVPQTTKEFAINMSNQRFWDQPVKDYVADLLQGEEGPLGKRYNMRWIASMVAEVHRILTRGGIFMYPWDSRAPQKPGKLRLMYEGNPMSFLIEQAGGRSVNTQIDIMDVEPEQIHERVSVVLGSKEEVETVLRYHGN